MRGPDLHLPIFGSADEALAVRCKGEAPDFAEMALQSGDALVIGEIPEANRVIHTGGGEGVPVRREGQASDGAGVLNMLGVLRDGAGILAGPGIPDAEEE